MSRRRASSSRRLIDRDRLLLDVLAEMRAEKTGGREVDGVTEQAALLVLDPEEPESHRFAGPEFDEEVDVAVRTRLTAEAGSEQGKPLDTVPAAQILEPLLVDFQARENHRGNASTPGAGVFASGPGSSSPLSDLDGGRCRIRTDDHLHLKQALYQLS